MRSSTVFPVLAAAILFALGAAEPTLAGAAPGARLAVGAPSPTAAEDPRVDRLRRDVERAESLRAVKRLQYAYAHYAQLGMWDEMADLFADTNAVAIFGEETVRGKAAIRAHLIRAYGAGQDGLGPNGLHAKLTQGAMVVLSPDGRSATGRWHELWMLNRGENASWDGGMELNEYIQENGVWKIARLHYWRQFTGPYETGWFPVAKELPLVPYPFTPAQQGRPHAIEHGGAYRSPPVGTLADVERRIDALNDEDKVRNLQHIYGYYQDRKMWDDVADLFVDDGVMEVAGVGVWRGRQSIRRGLEREGPPGLQRGQSNEKLQLETIVTISPNGLEAQVRGLEWGMLSPGVGQAFFSVAAYENRYLKQDGVWKINEMRIFPQAKTDYFQGWGKSRIVDPAPPRTAAPDAPTPAADLGAMPAFHYAHPVTGQGPSYPPGLRLGATQRLAPIPMGTGGTAPLANLNARLADAQRRLDISKAYDAVENVSTAFGAYLDDFTWDLFIENMAEDGNRSQGGGFYVGRDHLYRAMAESHIEPPSLSNPRADIRIHLRTQPVIDVAPDARSAKIRTRMNLYYARPDAAGAFNSGMYPNDTAVLEEGVWKMQNAGFIDETYFNSPGYKEGWSRPPALVEARLKAAEAAAAAERARIAAGGAPPASRLGNPISFPPDIPLSILDDFRRKNFQTVQYPDIKPMWFHYRNPVSGRTPENYCPELFSCHRNY